MSLLLLYQYFIVLYLAVPEVLRCPRRASGFLLLGFVGPRVRRGSFNKHVKGVAARRRCTLRALDCGRSRLSCMTSAARISAWAALHWQVYYRCWTGSISCAGYNSTLRLTLRVSRLVQIHSFPPPLQCPAVELPGTGLHTGQNGRNLQTTFHVQDVHGRGTAAEHVQSQACHEHVSTDLQQQVWVSGARAGPS